MKKYLLTLLGVSAITAGVLTLTPELAIAQSLSVSGGGFPIGGGDGVPPPPPPPRHIFVPPHFNPPPPPPSQPTPPPPSKTVTLPTLPTPNYINPIPTPTDVTNLNGVISNDLPSLNPNFEATDGIALIDDSLFPKQGDLGGNQDWILVRGDGNSKYEKTTPYSVKLDDGTIVVCVRHPSKIGLIETPDGKVALNSDGDVLLSYNDGTLRIFNLSARGTKLKVQVAAGIIDQKIETIAIAPGYEFLVSPHKLTRSDVRPSDGVARRDFKIMANGHVAVNEFSLESVLHSSAIIASMINHDNDPKDHRILNDMSKMAAVLNYVNGTAGFTSSTTGLATKPGAGTQ